MAGAGGTTIPVSARSPMGGQVSGGRDANELASIRAVAAAVPDPEIPALNLEDLGILRAVDVDKDGHVVVTITPTYSGCPAMEAITADVKAALAGLGYVDVTVRQVLAPAWTTDNMTQEGKAKLLEYGIAPPGRHSQGPVSVALSVRCPQCGSVNTRELSRFGSTACKSLWACNDCREPFDHFKAI
jgi:ring-1,2-phenylacetyl-CoA epoxidase subunit PaaD